MENAKKSSSTFGILSVGSAVWLAVQQVAIWVLGIGYWPDYTSGPYAQNSTNPNGLCSDFSEEVLLGCFFVFMLLAGVLLLISFVTAVISLVVERDKWFAIAGMVTQIIVVIGTGLVLLVSFLSNIQV